MTAEEILELVRSRSSPGVLILDREASLLYANEEALKMLKTTGEVPPEVRSLCEQLKAQQEQEGSDSTSESNCALLWQDGEFLCSMRAFLIGAQSKGQPATHIMVLIEKVTEQHGLNLRKAKAQYCLSDREIEVVVLLAQGLPNKEIGSRLFLSEYTIKDHIKNVMRKLGATSRSEIIHLLK